MKRFLFNLETLLRHREDIEQRERDELSHLSYRCQMELHHRDSLDLKRQATMNELARKGADNSERQELTWFYRYLDRLSFEIGESQKRLMRLEKEIQVQKEVVIEAAKKRKILSSMKAKKAKEYTLAVEKQEQKDVDELAVARLAHKPQ